MYPYEHLTKTFYSFLLLPDDPLELGTADGSTPRTRELSRRKISETSQAIASTSHDHNYGEPSSLRHTRRAPAPSRHQQAADELDMPVADVQPATPAEDPLQLPTERASRRLRDRPQKNVISSTNRRTSSRRLNDHDYGEVPSEPEPDEGEYEDEEQESDADDSDMAVADSSDEAEPATSDQDDVPLSQVANQRPLRTRPARNQEVSTDSPAARGSRGQKRPYYAEESDDESVHVRRTTSASTAAATTTTTASTKRRRTAATSAYAGDSDDVDENESPRRRSRTNGHTNGRNNHHHSDSESDENDEPQISVSSRGRVRKISNRVKNYLLD